MTPPASSTAATDPGRRLLIVYNPVAGRRRRARFESALARLRALGCVVTLRETAGPGDATALARAAVTGAAVTGAAVTGAAVTGDPDLVVAAGGDGTINEVVNGLVAAPGSRPRLPPLAILPLGTSNVLAREIGLGRDPEAAALAAARGRPRPVSLGRIDRPGEAPRHFLVMASVGFDAHVVAGVGSAAKRRFGAAAYLLEALRRVRRFPYPTYRVVIDGAVHEARSVIVANGARYAGAFVVAPEARIEDPGFQVCLLERGGPWQALRYGFGLVSGRLPRMAGVRIVPGRNVRIEAPGTAPGPNFGCEPIQCDGDLAGCLPADFVAVEDALSLVYPPENAAA